MSNQTDGVHPGFAKTMIERAGNRKKETPEQRAARLMRSEAKRKMKAEADRKLREDSKGARGQKNVATTNPEKAAKRARKADQRKK